jgi:hypothetical protein
MPRFIEKNEGTELSFYNIDLPPLNPLGDGNSCNLEEGEGETSGITKTDPPLNPESPMKEEGIPKIPDRWSAIRSPRGSDNQSIQIKYLDQEIPKYFWHIFLSNGTTKSTTSSGFHFGISNSLSNCQCPHEGYSSTKPTNLSWINLRRPRHVLI